LRTRRSLTESHGNRSSNWIATDGRSAPAWPIKEAADIAARHAGAVRRANPVIATVLSLGVKTAGNDVGSTFGTRQVAARAEATVRARRQARLPTAGGPDGGSSRPGGRDGPRLARR
jgi:hypothetical protein